MDLNTLRNLFSQVEALGVDTEPLREFIAAYRAGKADPSKHEHILEALQVAGDSYAPNSQPPQAQMLLRQLSESLEEERNNPSGQSNGSSQVTTNNMELLNLLLELKSDLRSLKEAPPTERIIVTQAPAEPRQEVAIETPKSIDTVFVNPIDDDSLKDIKGTVSIEAKTGGDISDKLNRLKQLKRG